MPARVSEAFVLRTYPFQEGDLIVGFFTRDQGRLRGVAKRARRPKSQFGSALERMSEVRISYHQKETLELVRIDNADLVQSQFGLAGCYEAGVALDFIAEVSDHLLPPAEPNERFYRLLAAVLADLRTSRESGVWRVATYFTYWAVRLSGFLPALRVSEESLALASAMAKAPISEFAGFHWTRDTAADLRRQLTRELESHIERRLATLPLMEAL
ncbi:MAG: DNA repair protein RecO [Bryobacteraceae bacterium]|nr:DNA repair protein RecO [Solibacteraceae bacterium]MCO5351478.1 DNA repair protein RecO [Bryobacteraceae bacterium]HRJ17927.1 DNA repair protein RecO [Bryobacteraceae bacterium]